MGAPTGFFFFQTFRCKRFPSQAEMGGGSSVPRSPGAAPFLSSVRTPLGPMVGSGMHHGAGVEPRALHRVSPPRFPELPFPGGTPQGLIYEGCVNVVWEQLAPSY